MGYKWIGKNSTQELAVEIQNVTNRENPYQVKYDPASGKVETYGMGLTPDLLYRISF